MEFYVTIYLYTQVYLVVIHHTNNFRSIKATVSIIYVAEVGSTLRYFRAPNELEIHYRLDGLKSDNENSDHFLSGI